MQPTADLLARCEPIDHHHLETLSGEVLHCVNVRPDGGLITVIYRNTQPRPGYEHLARQITLAPVPYAENLFHVVSIYLV